MVDRQGYLAKIKSRLLDYPVVALPGPRQAGKTTLAHLLAQGLPDTEIHHFDLESPSDLARLANPELVLSSLGGLIILDEIQRMPELYPVLRVLADRSNLPARFLILGSASPCTYCRCWRNPGRANLVYRRYRLFSLRNRYGTHGHSLVARRLSPCVSGAR